MVFAIIIGTKADGSKVAVSKVAPLSKKLKNEFRAVSDPEFKMVELFELRRYSKRRKISRTVTKLAAEPAAPTFNEIADKLATGDVVLPKEGFTAQGVPTVSAINQAFGVSIDAKARDDIWAKVEELRELAASKLKALGFDALAAALKMDVEELSTALEGFPPPEEIDEESSELIYDVESIREFLATLEPEE